MPKVKKQRPQKTLREINRTHSSPWKGKNIAHITKAHKKVKNPYKKKFFGQ